MPDPKTFAGIGPGDAPGYKAMPIQIIAVKHRILAANARSSTRRTGCLQKKRPEPESKLTHVRMNIQFATDRATSPSLALRLFHNGNIGEAPDNPPAVAVESGVFNRRFSL